MQKNIYHIITVALSLAGIIIFFRFPDLDIPLFGIGMHRFFLFHSVINPLCLLLAFVLYRQVTRIIGQKTAGGWE